MGIADPVWDPDAVTRRFAIWVSTLAVLTAGSIVWLHLDGIDPERGFSPAIIVIAYSPLVAAAVAATLTGGLREWVRQFGRWRVGYGWWIAVLAGPLLLVAVAHVLALPAGGPPPLTWFDAAGIAAAGGSLLAGSLGEEPGWRGLAQPELQRRLTVLTASVWIGLIWATWHNWTIWAPGAGPWPLPDIGLTYLRLVATSVIYGWLYLMSGSSLPLVMVAHLGHNVAVALLPVTDALTETLVAGLYGVVAIAVAVHLLRSGRSASGPPLDRGSNRPG